jgi:hypothetical protein
MSTLRVDTITESTTGAGVTIDDALSADGGILSAGITLQAAIQVTEGTAGARMGSATLVGGTATVNTTAVAATSRIFLTSNAGGGTPGWLRVSARVNGTSFTITSSSGTDTSTVAWLILTPA